MPYSDLPEPKYAIGQTVWYASTEQTKGRLPCPDCLGTQKWKAIAPSGQEYETPCPRCSSGFSSFSSSESQLLSLDYVKHEPRPRSFVIARIEAKTQGGWEKAPSVMYWSAQGSGMEEQRLFENEEQAQVISEFQANEANKKVEAAPLFLAQKNMSGLKLEDARFDMFKSGLWNAWYAFRDLTSKLTAFLEKEEPSSDDLEALRDDLKWDMQYNERRDDNPLIRLAYALMDHLDQLPDPIKAAYLALPEAIRTDRREPKAQDFT